MLLVVKVHEVPYNSWSDNGIETCDENCRKLAIISS